MVTYGKEFDGEVWRANLEETENHRWEIQQYKRVDIAKEITWVPMGNPKVFYEKGVAIQTLARLGYSLVG